MTTSTYLSADCSENQCNDLCTMVGPRPSNIIQNVACDHRHASICQHDAEITPTLQRSTEKGFSCFRKTGYFPDPNNCFRFFLCFGERKYGFNCSRGQIFSSEYGRCVEGTECPNDLVVDDASASPLDNRTTCELGFQKLKSKCYKIFRSSASWETANATCVERERGNLALVKTSKIMKFLKKIVKNTRRSYWIGLNNKARKTRYVWNDKTPLSTSSYSNWSTRSRQGKKKNKKRCVKLEKRARHKWMNANCNERNFFICEKEPIRQWTEPDEQCGRYKRRGVPRTERIIGGKVVTGEHHPWQVSLRFQGDHTCGGSLIDSCWVLTAAHCVTTSDGEISQTKLVTEAVLGDYNFLYNETAEERLVVDKIFVHPNWTLFPVPDNDIALIRLGACSVLHNPICLPTSREFRFSAGTRCVVSGYGTIKPGRKVYSKALLEAPVPIVAREKCKSWYRYRSRTAISPAMFCAGYKEGKIDACQGDSGGPLVCKTQNSKRIQAGIVSWGNGCALAKKPGVYTEIAHFYDWIRSVTYINY